MQISCGTISCTRVDGEIKYVIVREPRADYFGFPKGHMEPGETEKQTAIRETWEEASIHVDIIDGPRWMNRIWLKSGSVKKVVYFLARFENQAPRHNEEFEDLDVLLLPYEEAYETLTYREMKAFLKEANEYIKACAAV